MNWKRNPLYRSISTVLDEKTGWRRFKTLDGKVYYANVHTRETQWLHPFIPLGTIMENGLPHGWDTDRDSNHERYYICHVGKYNQREPPQGYEHVHQRLCLQDWFADQGLYDI